MKRAELVEKNHPKLSLREQCKILSVTRSTLNYRPVAETEEDLKIIRIMDEIYLEDPCVGSRRLMTLLERDHGITANRKRIMRLRRKMGIAVSMDGKGRWMDNVLVERLWRSVKYEDIYIRGYATIGELEAGIRRWIQRYNTWRPHQNLGNQTPAQVYETDRRPRTETTGMKMAP